MKRNTFKTVAAALAICAFASAACAQSNMNLRAVIPFQFTVGGTVLPSGVYEVRELEPSIIVLRNFTDHSSTLARTVEGQPEKGTHGKTLLVFHHYGSSYFLAQVTLKNGDAAQQLRMSPEEQKVASLTPKPQLVVVGLENGPVNPVGK